MFPFFSQSPAPEAATAAPAADQAPTPHPLDALTGGAFSAETSGERAARIRDWLASNPGTEQLQEVFKKLSTKDKGAARAIRERLEELRRASAQEASAADWAAKAEALLAAARLNIADALAWQRDAAKAGAPLSREPLAQLKVRLADQIKLIEDLQHRVQVQREAAVLIAQRIEVLSTKPWREAQAVREQLAADVAHWTEQAGQIMRDGAWPSVDLRFPPQLELAQTQLLAVWDAFQAALVQAAAASENAQAPLPPVPVWAEELRAARGEAAAPPAAPVRPPVDPERVAKAVQIVGDALARLDHETTEGHGKASVGAATALRAAWKDHGRFVDAALEGRVHAALAAAGELQGWQRWSADQIREDLLAKAQGLLSRPEGQSLGGRKMQELLRQLREQWKQADQGAMANHALWKKFDDACNAAHKVVETWLEKSRAEAQEHKAQRLALIEEVGVWTQAHAASQDWKMQIRSLHQFSERWRMAGHIGERMFAELQPLWRQAMDAAGAPLAVAQKANLDARRSLVDEAAALGAAPELRVDAIKALQQRWQVLAQAVPLERRMEQKLWDAFRKPIDEAFQRKSAQREQMAASLNAHDRAVLDASKALEAANAAGNADTIQAAMQALQAALRGDTPLQTVDQDKKQTPALDGNAQEATITGVNEASSESAGMQEGAPAPVAAVRRVVAVRGDDRPGAGKAAAAPARTMNRNDRRPMRPGTADRFGDRPERAERGPRLGDAAFRAQRDALEQAQGALRKLAAQAHGEALAQLMDAWKKRDASLLPAARDLGRTVSPAAHATWAKSVSGTAQASADDALLRLEIAADVPTPAEHHDARRALQLQMLTRRNDPSPQETWAQDTGRVLAGAAEPGSERRLQGVLKVLLRK